MLHLGDITKISGYTAPIVDVVVGGSPCQNFSVAGKRAGLDGERSGLFMEQLRIIKEMRENDKRNGATGDVRPRYMVWENVPGAFSSNKAEDFRIVLEETAKVCDKDAVIPMPDSGKWTTSGCILGNGWSIAWRVCDAQFYGVPQRRRRIALIADFGGHSAPEILFVRESVSGDSEQSKSQRKDTTTDAARGIGADDSIGVDIYNLTETGDKACSLTQGYTSTGTCPKVMTPIQCIDQGGGKSACNVTEGQTPTSTCTHGGEPAVCYSIENHPADSRVNIDESGKVQTLTSRMGAGGGNVPMVMTNIPSVVCLDRSSYNQGKNAKFDIGIDENGTAHSLVAKGPGAVAYSINHQGGNVEQILEDTVGTLTASMNSSGNNKLSVAYGFDQGATRDVGSLFLEEQSKTLTNGSCPGHHNGVCIKSGTRYIVRRLTPLECERLQGYPDGWTDIGEWTDSKGKVHKTSDAARYKALGNSIALPPWKWILKRLCACYERDATLASLFDGIGGFPLIWEQINGKGSCLWASEIEEFPIAVTKARIGE